jgi:hypothetical protein
MLQSSGAGDSQDSPSRKAEHRGGEDGQDRYKPARKKTTSGRAQKLKIDTN